MRSIGVVILLVVVAAVVAYFLLSTSSEGVVDEAGFTTVAGVKFKDVDVGTGKTAKPGDTVVMDYTGYLTNKTKFDSSRDHDEPFEFTLGARKVIQGWDIGIVGMKEGGKRILIIPPQLGYGSRGAPPRIPPNATLIFEVQLLKVKS